MKPKTILTVVILAFVAVAVGYLVVKEVRRARAPEAVADDVATPTAEPPPAETVVDPEKEMAASPGRVVVYYFYFGKRCATCLKIEKYTKEALERGFAEELAEGSVVWRPTDTDLPENRHFNGDYELFAKAVVVSDVCGDEEVRWKNLTKVWQLTGDKGIFMKYIQDEVRDYLEAG
jgi:hypothetical protein